MCWALPTSTMVKAIHIDMPTGPSNLFSPQLRLLSQVTLGCVMLIIKTHENPRSLMLSPTTHPSPSVISVSHFLFQDCPSLQWLPWSRFSLCLCLGSCLCLPLSTWWFLYSWGSYCLDQVFSGSWFLVQESKKQTERWNSQALKMLTCRVRIIHPTEDIIIKSIFFIFHLPFMCLFAHICVYECVYAHACRGLGLVSGVNLNCFSSFFIDVETLIQSQSVQYCLSP